MAFRSVKQPSKAINAKHFNLQYRITLEVKVTTVTGNDKMLAQFKST